MKKVIYVFCAAVVVGLANDIFADPMARIGDREFPMLYVNEGNTWDYDKALFWNWSDGAVAYLCGDFYDFVYDENHQQMWGPLGTGLPLMIGEGNAAIWDFDGHYLMYNGGSCFTIVSGSLIFRNGTIYQLSNGTTQNFNWAGSNTTMIFEDTFRFLNHYNGVTPYINTFIYSYSSSANCTIVIDGAEVESTYFYNFDGLGDGCSIVVRGSSDIRLSAWCWWGPGPASFCVKMRGGWWNLDPRSCGKANFSESCFVLDFGDDHGTLPERYRVFDNIEGWTFDSRRDFGLVLPAGEINSPNQPIAVELRGGGVLEERVMLADLSNVTVNGEALEFVSANSDVKISYQNGKLYAQPASFGMVIVIR